MTSAAVTPDALGLPPKPVWTAYVDTDPPLSYTGPDPLYSALRLCEALADRAHNAADDDLRMEPGVWLGEGTDEGNIVLVLRLRQREGHPLVHEVHDPEDPADLDVVLTTLYSLVLTEKLALDLPPL